MAVLVLLLKILLPLAYLGCLAFYAQLFFSADESKPARWAVSSLALALFLHVALLVALAAQYHRCPLWTQGEALLFMALMLGWVHLLSEGLAHTRRLGFFTLGPVALCVIAALFSLGKELVVGPAYRSSFFIFHIVASLASYASFSLAAVLAVLYLILYRKLKQKTFDNTFRKLPPLDKLDKLAAIWSFLGTLLMLVSSAIGAWWVRRDALRGMSPREIGIFSVLAVFLAAAVARRALGWRGQRYAWWILAGFALLILENLAGLHGFRF
jgi:HemX protein